MTVVVGLLRPDRPRRVVAEAEARVIATELERRLGELTLDLRVSGEAVGPWRSAATAAWPGGVDVVVDNGALWAEEAPALTALFGRTVDDRAAEVRTRMLRHLGVVPSTPFVLDRERLEALDAWHVSPTDLWLVAAAADAVETGDPAVDAFGGSGDGLDSKMDALAAMIDDETEGVMSRAVERLTAERDAARRALAGVSDELLRTRAEIADRLDALAAENTTLHERLRRRDLAAELDDP